MANYTTAAGDNGVSGATEGVSGGDTAIRTSVSKTSGASTASTVYSESKNLRFAYHRSECDSPARDRS